MNERKNRIPKDIVLLASELGAAIIMGIFGRLLGTTADFMEGFFLGIGAVTALTAVVIIIKRIRGKRRFGELDERERRIKEVAALWTVFVSILGLTLFAVAAFALPGLMSVGAGYVAVGASAVMTFVYLVSLLVASARM